MSSQKNTQYLQVAMPRGKYLIVCDITHNGQGGEWLFKKKVFISGEIFVQIWDVLVKNNAFNENNLICSSMMPYELLGENYVFNMEHTTSLWWKKKSYIIYISYSNLLVLLHTHQQILLVFLWTKSKACNINGSAERNKKNKYSGFVNYMINYCV